MLVRLQQQRRKRGRQCQRVECRDDRRAGDRQRELLVELSRNAGDEGGRDEHRGENERDRDNRDADLVHGDVRSLARRFPLCYVSFDVLDHHDRVVDDDTDRKDQAEQSQHVDGVAEGRHHREGADQRDRNRQDRDDRRAPRLQEDQHDEHDEGDRFPDRLRHRLDRVGDELRRVVGDGVVEALREVLLQPLHLLDDGLGRRECVRARPLVDAETDRIAAVEIGVGGVLLRAEFDARDVLEAQEPALVGLDDDLLELFRRAETSLGRHHDLEVGALRRRRLAERAAGDLHVLLLQRGDDLACAEAVRGELLRIEPDAKRQVRARRRRRCRRRRRGARAGRGCSGRCRSRRTAHRGCCPARTCSRPSGSRSTTC